MLLSYNISLINFVSVNISSVCVGFSIVLYVLLLV